MRMQTLLSLESHLIIIQRVFFFTGTLLKVSDTKVNPIKKVLSIRIFNGILTFRGLSEKNHPVNTGDRLCMFSKTYFLNLSWNSE